MLESREEFENNFAFMEAKLKAARAITDAADVLAEMGDVDDDVIKLMRHAASVVLSSCHYVIEEHPFIPPRSYTPERKRPWES